MTHTFRFAVSALSLSLLAFPALAQNAPIRIGPGGSPYQTQSPADNAQLARQSARITDLEAELSELTGRIENLEFRLTQRERAYEDAMSANATLRDQIADLSERIDDLAASPARSGASASRSGVSNPFAENSPATSGPRSLSGNAEAGSRDDRVTTRFPSAASSEDDMEAELEGSASPSTRPQGSLGTLAASQLPGQAGPLFELGKNRLLSFDYDGAEDAFRAFLEEFGDDEQAGEANYWLGEVLYLQGDYAGSARFLTTFVRDYADDPRRGDGVVKLARALREVGETDQACAFLGRLKQVDPDASARTVEAANVQRQLAGCN
tara:strand:+ start:944 stop:1912 length:969 start_codon:yes stop_codon:yes gene_type:complete